MDACCYLLISLKSFDKNLSRGKIVWDRRKRMVVPFYKSKVDIQKYADH